MSNKVDRILSGEEVRDVLEAVKKEWDFVYRQNKLYVNIFVSDDIDISPMRMIKDLTKKIKPLTKKVVKLIEKSSLKPVSIELEPIESHKGDYKVKVTQPIYVDLGDTKWDHEDINKALQGVNKPFR